MERTQRREALDMIHRFIIPTVVEVADPRVVRSAAVLGRQTVRSPYDTPPDDWAIIPPAIPARCAGRAARGSASLGADQWRLRRPA